MVLKKTTTNISKIYLPKTKSSYYKHNKRFDFFTNHVTCFYIQKRFLPITPEPSGGGRVLRTLVIRSLNFIKDRLTSLEPPSSSSVVPPVVRPITGEALSRSSSGSTQSGADPASFKTTTALQDTLESAKNKSWNYTALKILGGFVFSTAAVLSYRVMNLADEQKRKRERDDRLAEFIGQSQAKSSSLKGATNDLAKDYVDAKKPFKKLEDFCDLNTLTLEKLKKLECYRVVMEMHAKGADSCTYKDVLFTATDIENLKAAKSVLAEMERVRNLYGDTLVDYILELVREHCAAQILERDFWVKEVGYFTSKLTISQSLRIRTIGLDLKPELYYDFVVHRTDLSEAFVKSIILEVVNPNLCPDLSSFALNHVEKQVKKLVESSFEPFKKHHADLTEAQYLSQQNSDFDLAQCEGQVSSAGNMNLLLDEDESESSTLPAESSSIVVSQLPPLGQSSSQQPDSSSADDVGFY